MLAEKLVLPRLTPGIGDPFGEAITAPLLPTRVDPLRGACEHSARVATVIRNGGRWTYGYVGRQSNGTG